MTGAVAAIDLGATSGRVIVGHVGPDTLTADVVGRFANEQVTTQDGLHWNVLGLYAGAVAGLREAFRAAPQIASIGVDSWAVDYGLLRDGRLLGNPFHYRDERTQRGVDAVHARISYPELFARNGLQFLPFNTLYQFAAEPEELLNFADAALLIPDLIGYWLTGEARAEQTNASTTGLTRTDGTWDEELLATLGLPRGLFPAIIRPGDRLGAVRSEFAASLGAPDGISVTAVGSLCRCARMLRHTSRAARGVSWASRLNAPWCRPRRALQASRTKAASTGACACCATSWACGC